MSRITILAGICALILGSFLWHEQRPKPSPIDQSSMQEQMAREQCLVLLRADKREEIPGTPRCMAIAIALAEASLAEHSDFHFYPPSP